MSCTGKYHIQEHEGFEYECNHALGCGKDGCKMLKAPFILEGDMTKPLDNAIFNISKETQKMGPFNTSVDAYKAIIEVAERLKGYYCETTI